MTLDNLKKKLKHLIFLSKGEFRAQDFDREFGTDKLEDSGFSHMGKLTTDRKLLIISDAKRHLKNLLKKYPELEVKKKVEEPKETKPKEKK